MKERNVSNYRKTQNEKNKLNKIKQYKSLKPLRMYIYIYIYIGCQLVNKISKYKVENIKVIKKKLNNYKKDRTMLKIDNIGLSLYFEKIAKRDGVFCNF